MKNLEDRFGVRLVRRGSRFQGFTSEGARVLDWARGIVAVPTALPMVAALTTPFRARYPDVRFTVESRASSEILDLFENLEIDAGLTYLDNEPLGRVVQVPLYRERYRLITAADGPLGERDRVTWAEVGHLPLCLLTPNMQNRRIVDQQLRAAGHEPAPLLESNSTIVLITHVRTLAWASIMPIVMAEPIVGLSDRIRSIPIVEPDVSQTIGIVAPHREPATPMVQALFAIARQVAPSLGNSVPDETDAVGDKVNLSVDGTA